ncbi:MAG: hypothetical protein NC311_14555 [Muribaculaceae bacterium]|nr:hypothetical protein [Muribaculaceae bacterium]
MKKFFTLLAVSALAASASAADVYSWSSVGPEASDVTEFGGKATHENGDPEKANRVNYKNADYYTICLNGKKAEMGGAPSDNASYIQIALDQPLEAGCTLELSGYLNKGEEKVANAYVVFLDATGNTISDLSEEESYPDLVLNPELVPGVHSIAAPEGCKIIRMTRNSSQTNVFLTSVKVTKEGGEQGVGESLSLMTYSNATQTTSATTLTSIYPDAEGNFEEVSAADGLKWENGVEMYLVKNEKTYGGGNTNAELNKPIKLSNGAPNLVVLPAGFTLGKIVAYGYCNTADQVTYISDVSVVKDGVATSVFTGTADGPTLPNVAKDDWSAMTLEDMPKAEYTLSEPVSGQFWFKNGGKQPVLYMELVAYNGSGVANIETDENAPVEYYNLQGVRVANPENGIYIRRQGSKATKVLVK